jgi:hypothetical protein
MTEAAMATAPVAVLVTRRMTRLATEGFSASLLAGLALDFAGAGLTVFGAALPKVSFVAVFFPAAEVPVPVLDCALFDCAAFVFFGAAAFFALVAMTLFLLAGSGAIRTGLPRH